jgi:hypothetical protein
MTKQVDLVLMYEVLKSVQADVGFIKSDLADVKAMQLRIREDLNRFAGDFLRVERMEAETQVRLERIESRLDLGTRSNVTFSI